MVQLLGWQIGNLIVADELSRSTELNIATCSKYLYLLEDTFVINLIKPFYNNKRLEIIKAPKVFFNDTGLRNTVTNNYEILGKRADAGQLVENYVFSQLSKKQEVKDLKYWRKKNSGLEMDFILENQYGQEILPLEVKFQNLSKTKITKSFYSFWDNYTVPKAVIVTKNLFDKLKLKKTEVYFVPVWVL